MITKCCMTFPAMIKMGRKKSVEIIRQTLLEFLALHCRLRHGPLQNVSFELSRRLWHGAHFASLKGAAYRRQSFMTHGTPHCMLAHEPVSFGTNYALNVVSQLSFEIHTKHRFSLPAPTVFLCSFLLPARVR